MRDTQAEIAYGNPDALFAEIEREHRGVRSVRRVG
jgi:hypothetical protein